MTHETETERKLRKLQKCVRASHILGLSLDLKETLTRVMRSAEDVMESEASCIMLLDKDGSHLIPTFLTTDLSKETSEQDHIVATMSHLRFPIGHGVAGWVAQKGESALVPDAYSDPRFNPEADKKTGFKTRSILCVPLIVQGKMIGVAQVLNKKTDTYDDLDREIFEVYATRAAVAIHTAQLHADIVEKRKMEQQMEIARTIQSSLQGPGVHESGRFHYAALSAPALFVGGDFHDLYKLPDGRFYFLFGDVSGKGMPAALLMSQIITAFRSLSPILTDPASLLTNLNRELQRSTAMGMFATCFCGLLEPETERLVYSNAGHQPPYLWGEGDPEALPRSKNIPIGIMPSWQYTRETIDLKKRGLLLYTDGVTEAVNTKNEAFEEKGIISICNTLGISSCKDLVRTIVEQVQDFEEGQPPHDDTTVCAFRLF